MKIIVALVASLFLIAACNDEQEAQAGDVTVEDLAPLPTRTADLGITLGTRYELNADDSTQNKMRLFLSKQHGSKEDRFVHLDMDDHQAPTIWSYK